MVEKSTLSVRGPAHICVHSHAEQKQKMSSNLGCCGKKEGGGHGIGKEWESKQQGKGGKKRGFQGEIEKRFAHCISIMASFCF